MILIVLSSTTHFAQQQPKDSKLLWEEVKEFVEVRVEAMRQQGKRPKREDVDRLRNRRQRLARQNAKIIESRPNLAANDYFYLGMIYDAGGDYDKALDVTSKYLAMAPPDTKPSNLQSVREAIIVFAGRTKNFDVMERTFLEWSKGETKAAERQELLRTMAVHFYNGRKYKESVKYGEEAWKNAKAAPARTLRERRAKDRLYSDLAEVLAMGYRRIGRKDDSITLLAEGRAMSFSIPSAGLYRKVMEIVGRLRISEKRLMQRLESFDGPVPAPDLSIDQWIDLDPTELSDLRGKVVLLDFWYTWCTPCIITFPRLRSWDRKYGKRGLVIIGVTGYMGQIGGQRVTKEQEYDYIAKFKKKHRLRYGVAIQDDMRSSESEYGIGAFPTTVLIDRKGTIRYIGVGAGEEENLNLGAMIKKLIKEKADIAQN